MFCVVSLISLWYFNSIKVRLELNSENADFILSPFQFHKGTIRTCPCSYQERTPTYFNSIKVRLEQSFAFNFNSYSCYFNSIKVRLEHTLLAYFPYELSLFQFHKGTIRTNPNILFMLENVENFNSIKVRLERKTATALRLFSTISIP